MTECFKLDKQQLKQAFSQSALSYDSVTQLQRTIGNALLQHLEITRTTDSVADLGCGTGFLTAELVAMLRCERMVAVDLALPMLYAARHKLSALNKVTYVCADAEKLPFLNQSFDSIFSNLMLQWCVDLAAIFTEIKRTLKPNGQLIFSIFGPATLQELKHAWAAVDDYSHVNYFYALHELEQFLQDAGFEIIKTHQQHYISQYDSVWALMKELKAIGAHNVNSQRNKQLTSKSQLHAMLAAYPHNKDSTGVCATFEVISVVARTPK
ncbi:malonyl-ACP O-methyltransferase BioC [Crenothrix polyspora]|uniref:Malonyl-[acyl-carrier protein] O-methyltransferase n=1 Tax=Crenothrix polyspora TaxID=360316 RepID=A0A1R4H586_9GAMM|nr:malonyl-ACP O-methyltransferase BioC [Crenothrix polyspora]SJM91413.1 Malonyl-(acyl-carrier protein) O-methyltransferase [Crenothrix polyspora]